MKFKVKVGKEFHVEFNSDSKNPSTFSLKKFLVINLVVVAITSVIASTIYGYATDDFSSLMAIAEMGRSAISAFIKRE